MLRLFAEEFCLQVESSTFITACSSHSPCWKVQNEIIVFVDKFENICFQVCLGHLVERPVLVVRSQPLVGEEVQVGLVPEVA